MTVSPDIIRASWMKRGEGDAPLEEVLGKGGSRVGQRAVPRENSVERDVVLAILEDRRQGSSHTSPTAPSSWRAPRPRQPCCSQDVFN